MPPALRFDKLLCSEIRCSSESQSEISSVDSEWNDKGSIALQLGISDPNDMANERFKVDRQKLENLIKGNHFWLHFEFFINFLFIHIQILIAHIENVICCS